MAKDLLIQQIPETDEPQFAELTDRCFQVHEGQSYLNDFPVWRGHTPEVLKMGAYDGKKLVGSACVRIADLWVKDLKQILVGLIGAVATDKEYRGRGIAKRLVSLAADWAQNRGAPLAVLWGSEHELYAKIGFHPCGRQVRVPLAGLIRGTPTQIQEGWNPALFRALQNRKSGLALQKVDSLWMSAQENVKWFWTGPKDAPTAYLALGRGIDLTHMVHEWGGSPHELLPLLAQVAVVDPQAEILGSPGTFTKAGIQYDPSAIEYLCLAKVMDPAAILRAFTDHAQASSRLKNGIWIIELEIGGDHIEASPGELSRLFFGPSCAGDPVISQPWSDIFPLPLWFWGLDAV
jgi:predicted N-acetyltransferase YhbS